MTRRPRKNPVTKAEPLPPLAHSAGGVRDMDPGLSIPSEGDTQHPTEPLPGGVLVSEPGTISEEVRDAEPTDAGATSPDAEVPAEDEAQATGDASQSSDAHHADDADRGEVAAEAPDLLEGGGRIGEADLLLDEQGPPKRNRTPDLPPLTPDGEVDMTALHHAKPWLRPGPHPGRGVG